MDTRFQAPVTIKHLLTHTSGFRDDSPEGGRGAPPSGVAVAAGAAAERGAGTAAGAGGAGAAAGAYPRSHFRST